MKETMTEGDGFAAALAYIAALALLVVGGFGWVLNFFEIAKTDHLTGMLILRVIGIFFMPMGAVLGWV